MNLPKIAIELLASYGEVETVYLFGSIADGTATPQSDFDIGVRCKSGLSKEELYNLQFELAGKLCLVLKTDKVDLIVLGATSNSELRYNIIHDGIVCFDRSRDRIAYETRIAHEYEDHIICLRRHGLTAR